MEVLETKDQIGGRAYTVIGEAEANSCARQSGASPQVDAAKEKMRIEAAKLGGNAVINTLCEEAGINVLKN